MTIKVYSSIMPGEPDEVYHDHGMTVEAWVEGQAPNYKRGDTQPISCMINGTIIKPMDWPDTVIGEKDSVEFRIVPRGDVLDFVFPFWSGSVSLAQAAVDLFIPEIPGQRGQGQQGQDLNPARAKANVARLNQVIPEGIGEYIRYPDYLNEPRRYYVTGTVQRLEIMLCIGWGEYEIPDATVRIGETPINEIENASYIIYEPGQNVTFSDAHENWYSSKEVGSTTNSAGIRLKGISFDERTYFGTATGSGNDFNGIDVGDLWVAGLEGDVKTIQDINVVDGGVGDPDIFQGDFQHLVAGITVAVESGALSTNGDYVVSTINGAKTEITLETTGGSPVTDATPGSAVMYIDKAGTDYKILTINSSSSIEVERILNSGSADPDWTGSVPQGALDVEMTWQPETFDARWVGPFSACPEGETTDTIEVDILAPQGLGEIDGESIDPVLRVILVQYREVGTTTWTDYSFFFQASTRDQLGFTEVINLPSAIRPEVRIARQGEESEAVTSLDKLEWQSLRAKLPTVTSYPGATTMAVTITGSDEISNQSNNRINVVAKRKLPEISGGVLGSPVATRKISAAAAYVAKDTGYDDDQIDLAELERLEDIWTPRGDAFDFFFSEGTAKEALDSILRPGFSELTIDRGVLTPVRDEPRSTFEQGYSPENMTAPLQRTFQARQVDEADGVEVEYTDSSTWTQETVQALLPGDAATKLDKITLDGVTDRTKAWRIGMRRRRAQRYRRWTYQFNTELDALNSSYLSYVPLLDDIPGYGKVMILEGIESDRITVSEPAEFVAGETHVVAYRDENGDVVGPFTATEGPDEYTILVTIPEPHPAVLPSNREPTHIYFGTTARWHFPALISEIRPSGPLEVGVTATNYDARVYDDDDNSPS